jgi:hypothetical protein
MTLKSQYFRYLETFRGSVPIRDFLADPRRDLVTLRHDIDYSLDCALETAFWEYRNGVRATYFLLDTAPYWDDDRFLDKCRQLADFGHEIGIHLNALAKWYSGEVSSVADDIQRTLARLRESGLEIVGTAAHGDRRCYEGGFINYWCLQDLRPDDPMRMEHGLSAEGVPTDNPQHQVPYPSDHRIRRADGAAFDLWSIPMASFGLQYDAMHVQVDRYFTDSGGNWVRSADPLTEDLRRGRHQILMHPIHWRDLPRKYFFLSTARSGSLWLSRVLEDASSAHGVHEFTLNHTFADRTIKAEKRTFGDLQALVNDRAEARSLLTQSREYTETLSEDWAEVNVYLPHFLDELTEVFPDAKLIHLHRNLQDVVQSLMNRDWYETPDDPLRPPVDMADRAQATQFERVCTYVARTNEALLDVCPTKVSFERMTKDTDYLLELFAGIGLAFFPRLAAPLMQTRLNETRESKFPAPAEWSATDVSAFNEICGPIVRHFGYDERQPKRATATRTPPRERLAHRKLFHLKAIDSMARRSLATLLKRMFPDRKPAPKRIIPRLMYYPLIAAGGGCTLESLMPLAAKLSGEKHGFLLFGGGRWNTVGADSGFPFRVGSWFRGSTEIHSVDGLQTVLYCLSYDQSNAQIEKKLIGTLKGSGSKQFSFRPRATASRFVVAMYFSKAFDGPSGTKVRVKSFDLDEMRSR